jgi:hypothetical protein
MCDVISCFRKNKIKIKLKYSKAISNTPILPRGQVAFSDEFYFKSLNENVYHISNLHVLARFHQVSRLEYPIVFSYVYKNLLKMGKA